MEGTFEEWFGVDIRGDLERGAYVSFLAIATSLIYSRRSILRLNACKPTEDKVDPFGKRILRVSSHNEAN